MNAGSAMDSVHSMLWNFEGISMKTNFNSFQIFANVRNCLSGAFWRGEKKLNWFSTLLNNICSLNFLVAGLQHAHSVGNLGLSAHHPYNSNGHLSGRSYESDDENMGRKKTRPVGHGLYPKTSVYSKGDIREQVRLHSVLLPWNCHFFLYS